MNRNNFGDYVDEISHKCCEHECDKCTDREDDKNIIESLILYKNVIIEYFKTIYLYLLWSIINVIHRLIMSRDILKSVKNNIKDLTKYYIHISMEKVQMLLKMSKTILQKIE